MKSVLTTPGSRPIKLWTDDIEPTALQQLRNLATLPFIAPNGVACMPDVHAGIGATVGTVIATDQAIIPAAVGVDIGCGMNAVRLSLHARDLPDSLTAVRQAIERDVPLGAGGRHQGGPKLDALQQRVQAIPPAVACAVAVKGKGKGKRDAEHAAATAVPQLGTLGSGNHFIELCLDEQQAVWVMLHSGSRGIGNQVGRHYIERAKRRMEQHFIHLPDADLAYLPEDTDDFRDYLTAVQWAQDYALENRRVMMEAVIAALRRTLPLPFTLTREAINCHHNYVVRERHFNQNLWVTRKGAIRAGEGDLGIIPGSMGQRSYIVRGKGQLQAYCSCAHGAGRRMSRTQARRSFNVGDLKRQTEGVECRKDAAVLDEIPAAYKDIDQVMANQTDLVEVVHTLKQVLCVKGA